MKRRHQPGCPCCGCKTQICVSTYLCKVGSTPYPEYAGAALTLRGPDGTVLQTIDSGCACFDLGSDPAAIATGTYTVETDDAGGASVAVDLVRTCITAFATLDLPGPPPAGTICVHCSGNPVGTGLVASDPIFPAGAAIAWDPTAKTWAGCGQLGGTSAGGARPVRYELRCQDDSLGRGWRLRVIGLFCGTAANPTPVTDAKVSYTRLVGGNPVGVTEPPDCANYLFIDDLGATRGWFQATSPTCASVFPGYVEYQLQTPCGTDPFDLPFTAADLLNSPYVWADVVPASAFYPLGGAPTVTEPAP